MLGREKEHSVPERDQEDHQVYQQETGTLQTVGDIDQHDIISCTEHLCKCHNNSIQEAF